MREVLEYLEENMVCPYDKIMRQTLERWRGYIEPGPYQIGAKMHDEADKRLMKEIEEVLR